MKTLFISLQTSAYFYAQPHYEVADEMRFSQILNAFPCGPLLQRGGHFSYSMPSIIYKGHVFKADPCGPPPFAGVYMVVITNCKTMRDKIVYIGSSRNIQKRVLNLNHPYLVSFNRLSSNHLVCTRSVVTENYAALEVEMINHFKPIFNRTHKKPLAKGIIYG